MNRRPVVGLFLCLTLVLGIGCGQDEESRKKPRKAQPSASGKAGFKLGEVRGVSTQDRPEAPAKANEEATKVIALLNGLYEAAFLGPSTEDVAKIAPFFTAEAGAQLAPNFGALALGDLSDKLGDLSPKTQQAIKMTFFVEDDLSSPSGVVTVLFEARAPATTKKQGPVTVVHNAGYWLTRDGDAYKISAYSAELKADGATKTGAFGIPAGGEPR